MTSRIPPHVSTLVDEQVRRWNLACRILQATGPVEITTDDAADIRRLADLHFGTLVYAQLDALLAAAEK